MRRLLALAAAALAVAAPVAHAKRVRVFAVGPKLDLGWLDSREHYRAHLLGLVDRSMRGPDVQPEADDVASHLLGPADPAKPVETARDLVVFPEDLGLMAVFTGSQGSAARGAGSVTEAIARVIAAYAPQEAYYAAKFPDLANRGVPTRLAGVALTDTIGRVAVETYAEIAKRERAWVVGGVDMVQDWHVVCQSRATMPELPGGATCDEVDPAKVAQLRSPDEPSRTYAFEATSDRVSNMALVFDPTGKLVSKQVKEYLTPIELSGGLDLLPGEVLTGVRALPTPVGTLGFVTSKDAWMPDVVERLDEEHVDLLLQPEYFVGDTVASTGVWAPDNVQGAGYSDVLRAPSISAMALPSMTGNLFELSADNQQAIAVKPRSTHHAPTGFLVGQPPAPGYARVGDWVAKDPLSPLESIPDRRHRLGLAGEKLLPKSDNPACPTPASRGVCRGGQVEDVIFQDVQVSTTRAVLRVARRRRGRTPFTVDRPIAPSRDVQRNVALAASGRLVVAAFEQRTDGRDQVLVAHSEDGGAHWSRPLHATGRPAGAGDEWWPALAIGPDDTIWLAWSDDADGRAGSSSRQRVYVARSADGASRFSAPVAVDAGVGPAVQQLRPAIAATGPGRAVVAFVDDRARFTADDLPQAGIWMVPLHEGTPGRAIRLDSTAAPDPLAATLDNAWAPSLAASGDRVQAAWIDFRRYQWDVFTRASTDGGASWGAETRVNRTADGDEALEDTPRVALVGGQPVFAFTDWAQSRGSATQASPLYDVDAAVGDGAPAEVDGRAGAHADAFAPAVAAVGSGALVAWEDHLRGPGDIDATLLRGGQPGKPFRVDDSGTAGWNQWRPALAVADRHVVAAWEDERDGPAQIFYARASIRRIG